MDNSIPKTLDEARALRAELVVAIQKIQRRIGPKPDVLQSAEWAAHHDALAKEQRATERRLAEVNRVICDLNHSRRPRRQRPPRQPRPIEETPPRLLVARSKHDAELLADVLALVEDWAKDFEEGEVTDAEYDVIARLRRRVGGTYGPACGRANGLKEV